MSLFYLFLLQQQVYEVKLEDGNVFVKHAGRLSLEPLPAEQKESWRTSAETETIPNIPQPHLPLSAELRITAKRIGLKKKE